MDYKKICYTIYATQVKDIYVIRKLYTGQSGMSKNLSDAIIKGKKVFDKRKF